MTCQPSLLSDPILALVGDHSPLGRLLDRESVCKANSVSFVVISEPNTSMASRLSSSDVSRDGSGEWEKEGLIQSVRTSNSKRTQNEGRMHSRCHVVSLYAIISSLMIVILALTARLHWKPFSDPTLGVYCEILSYYCDLSEV